MSGVSDRMTYKTCSELYCQYKDSLDTYRETVRTLEGLGVLSSDMYVVYMVPKLNSVRSYRQIWLNRVYSGD